ncbi:MAG: hypothetical protein IJ608_01510 [Lachnospiraceae bacterium]|nr:hypothetical protein [Lachnospiraceae bacterium]
MGYIKVPRVYDKLKKAEAVFSPVIMTAANGWGKTAAVDYYYRRKSPLILHCKDGNICEMSSFQDFRGSVVIIEDMQWLTEDESVRFLRKLLRISGIQVVMLTRGTVPKYLASEDMDFGFVRIQENDFALEEREVDEFFKERGIDLHPDDVAPLTEASKGYIRALHCYAARMENGTRYSEDLKAAVWQDIYHLWDGYVFEQCTDEFIHFALCVCQYEEFTLEMAEFLTHDKNVGRVIEYCRETMSQIEVRREGYYSIRPETRGYYCWKQNIAWSKEAVIENYRRGADYYEMTGDISNALKYYKKAGAIQRIKELLIRNANVHPGIGHYVEVKEYYFELPEEELKELPVLIAGMSMLYDLILMPEKSEKWHHELELFCKDKIKSREKRREAREWLAYLDIALPHKGTKGILRTMKNIFVLIKKGDITLPEFAATGNLPSIMNGGLDFCEWSKNDIQIAKFMGKPLEVIVGRYGKGLVTIALAESGFEKGTMPAYEVMTRCNDGFEAAAHGGRIEMCFVAVGIQIRQHLIEGQLPSAKRVFKFFYEKAQNENAIQLFKNLEVLRIWLSLFGGSNDAVRSFIEEVPDARASFNSFDRYKQIIKLRCLIAESRLEEAFDLASFMESYLAAYERHFCWMEVVLLKAVTLYRFGDDHWKENLVKALIKGAEYHFVRLFSIEGAAILPLLKQMREEKLPADIDGGYLDFIYT